MGKKSPLHHFLRAAWEAVSAGPNGFGAGGKLCGVGVFS